MVIITHRAFLSGFVWMREYMKVTNKICSCISMSGSIGVVILTFTIGQVIEDIPLILMYQSFATLSLSCIILGVASIIGRSILKQNSIDIEKKNSEAKTLMLEKS